MYDINELILSLYTYPSGWFVGEAVCSVLVALSASESHLG
jgi:hypothetical protein